MTNKSRKIGYACAYTPLILIEAAGFIPYRILPMGDADEQAGHILHENICPHIKRILDRLLSNEIPELFAMVFVNSCDAMRRLADAWQKLRPNDKIILLDLPYTDDENAISFFANELKNFKEILESWSNTKISNVKIIENIVKYNCVSNIFFSIYDHSIDNQEKRINSAVRQEMFNYSSCHSINDVLCYLKDNLFNGKLTSSSCNNGVPILLFGNVLPDPKVFSFFESCNASIVFDDVCTGIRMFSPISADGYNDILLGLSKGILKRMPCARMISSLNPNQMIENIVFNAKKFKVKGVIAHVIKFCDPYISKIPMIKNNLKKENIPFLLIEGDCSLRSIEQQRTRIEAFIEMIQT